MPLPLTFNVRCRAAVALSLPSLQQKQQTLCAVPKFLFATGAVFGWNVALLNNVGAAAFARHSFRRAAKR